MRAPAGAARALRSRSFRMQNKLLYERNLSMKKTFYTELAYVLGILILAMGTASMEKAGFGVSMVVAPAYLLHLKISQTLPFYTFGTSEYCLQAVLLVLLFIVLRRFKKGYLFSFVTAVIFGLTLDRMIMLLSGIPADTFVRRGVFYILGVVLCSLGVSFLFHTYIAPEAYELFVKEISASYGFDISKTKTVYDCCSCLIGVILSFIFFGFGHFEGVKLGTILCAAINGSLIGMISRGLESVFKFRDGLPLRKYFEE